MFRIFADMNVKSKIMVLHVVRYSDDKLIAECWSEREGRVSFVVRVSHSSRAAVRYTLFQPLAVLEAEWTVRSRGGLVAPKSVRVALPFATLHADARKATVALFLSEMLLYVVRSEEVGEAMFDFVERGLEWFDTAPVGRATANFHIVFLLRLSLFLGITPNLDECELPYFDLMAGEFAATAPSHAYYIYGAEATAFAQLMRMNFGTMHLFALSREQRGRILELVLQYYRLHLPSMPEPRSLDVLREVFD